MAAPGTSISKQPVQIVKEQGDHRDFDRLCPGNRWTVTFGLCLERITLQAAASPGDRGRSVKNETCLEARLVNPYAKSEAKFVCPGGVECGGEPVRNRRWITADRAAV